MIMILDDDDNDYTLSTNSSEYVLYSVIDMINNNNQYNLNNNSLTPSKQSESNISTNEKRFFKSLSNFKRKKLKSFSIHFQRNNKQSSMTRSICSPFRWKNNKNQQFYSCTELNKLPSSSNLRLPSISHSSPSMSIKQIPTLSVSVSNTSNTSSYDTYNNERASNFTEKNNYTSNTKGRNNSAKDPNNTPSSSVGYKKKNNFLKKLFNIKMIKKSEKKSKNDGKILKPNASCVTLSNQKISISQKPKYKTSLSPSAEKKNCAISTSTSDSMVAITDPSAVSQQQIGDKRSSVMTKLTITDELNRTRLVAQSNPELSLENYKIFVENAVNNLKSVEEMMYENIKKLYDRKEALYNLEEKANELKRESSYLQLTAKQVKTVNSNSRFKFLTFLGVFLLFVCVSSPFAYQYFHHDVVPLAQLPYTHEPVILIPIVNYSLSNRQINNTIHSAKKRNALHKNDTHYTKQILKRPNLRYQLQNTLLSTNKYHNKHSIS